MLRNLTLLLTITFYCSGIFGQTQPNFVFIIADDLNDYVQGFDGNPQSKTPNISKIEKKGTTFLNAYTASPKCAPSRTTMITGKDCLYTQVYDNSDIGCKNFRKNFKEALGNEVVFTIPEMLKDSGGYFTYTISKVMHCYVGLPDFDTTIADPCLKGLSWSKSIAFGFDEGGAGEGGGDFTEILDYGDANDDGVNGFRFTPIPDSMESGMIDYVATDSAIEFINDYAAHPENYCNKPFFLSLGYKRPHGPFYIPEKYFLSYYNTDWSQNPYNLPYNDPVGGLPYNGLVMPPQPDPMWSDFYNLPPDGVAVSLIKEDYVHDDFLEFGDYKLAEVPPPVIDATMTDEEKLFAVQEAERANGIIAYMACVKFIDAQIGRFYNAVKSHPEIFNNTVFIITSDHGYSMGEKTHWRKDCLWETDTRIPLVIADMRTPGKKTCKRVVSNVDMMPTILDLAGVAFPTFPDGSQYVDGYSLAPLITAPNTPFDRPVLSSITMRSYTAEGTCFPHYSIRDDEWHYIRYQTNGATPPDCNEALSTIEEELYHIGKNRNIDPYEWTNLADNPAYTATKDHLATFLPGGVNYLQIDRLNPEENIAEENYIGAYPNPSSTNTYFNIDLPTTGLGHLYIYDIMGSLITDLEFEVNDEGFAQLTLPVTGMTQGYYIAKVVQGEFNQSVNFIVAR